MPPAIRVENLGKQYMLGEFERYSTFREMLARSVTRPAARLARRLRGRHQPSTINHQPSTPEPDTIWALRDVSFEVQHGEVLGIIGRNGAGKSTLLKILSRITEPTTGYAEIRGRVGSLLEVGTGFHPELTGRENVYLNGAILGMSRAEIRRKFDDIVSFAGVEKFIDTPVKRYSSGMQVRLAFAVAAHLDPEILIIDEVLAVGDAEFQKRCLGKMNEVSRSGRTVLFVSHNMAAVEGLCTRAILLDSGCLATDSDTASVISSYVRRNGVGRGSTTSTLVRSRWLRELQITALDGAARAAFRMGESVAISLVTQSRCERDFRVALLIYNVHGLLVAKCFSYQQRRTPLTITPGSRIVCELRNVRLVPGSYTISLVLFSGAERVEEHTHVGSFAIVASDVYGTGRLPMVRTGVYLPEATWRVDGEGGIPCTSS